MLHTLDSSIQVSTSNTSAKSTYAAYVREAHDATPATKSTGWMLLFPDNEDNDLADEAIRAASAVGPAPDRTKVLGEIRTAAKNQVRAAARHFGRPALFGMTVETHARPTWMLGKVNPEMVAKVKEQAAKAKAAGEAKRAAAKAAKIAAAEATKVASTFAPATAAAQTA